MDRKPTVTEHTQKICILPCVGVAVLTAVVGVVFVLLLEPDGAIVGLVLLVVRPTLRLSRSDWDCKFTQSRITLAFSNTFRSRSWEPMRPRTWVTFKACAFQIKQMKILTGQSATIKYCNNHCKESYFTSCPFQYWLITCNLHKWLLVGLLSVLAYLVLYSFHKFWPPILENVSELQELLIISH